MLVHGLGLHVGQLSHTKTAGSTNCSSFLAEAENVLRTSTNLKQAAPRWTFVKPLNLRIAHHQLPTLLLLS